ncbi:hypothetical protein AB4Y36_10270 [Paraburkholderia sp. BR10936]|uniref:hypothetical protein n=1 Tax=Paraburkholderia sp. BR10936 TaxID=3236993 RepID=UPI0034D15FED
MDEFAVRGVIQFADGVTPDKEIVGLYDGPYVKTTLKSYVQDTTAPIFTTGEGACKPAKRGDTLVVYEPDGVTVFGTFGILTYPQVDGHGLEVLSLDPD